MHTVQHTSVADFRERVFDYLMTHEVENNLLLGITQRLIDYPDAYDSFLLAHVEDDNGEIIAALMRTPPHGPALSKMSNPDALPHLVAVCAEHYETLPSIYGEPETALTFAELWQAHSDQVHHIRMEQGLYHLTEVNPPYHIEGSAHRATSDHLDVVIHFFEGFEEGTGLGPTPHDQIEKMVRRRLGNDPFYGVWLWCIDGQAVSMAGTSRDLPHGCGVSLVYTPPALRGRGYASAVTAAVSQAILDAGKQYAFLYTDLANPTSNKIYQAIGYKHITNHRFIEFYKLSDEGQS